MTKLYDKFSRCWKSLNYASDEKGQTLVEYGLILILIAVVVIFMLEGTGLRINSVYSTINSGLP